MASDLYPVDSAVALQSSCHCLKRASRRCVNQGGVGKQIMLRVLTGGAAVTALLIGYCALFCKDPRNYNYKTLAHLKRLGMMFHVYHEKKGHFPPAYLVDSTGHKLHSWRVLLLEFEDPSLFARIKLTEPWNSEHNKTLRGAIPYFFVPPEKESQSNESQFLTSYFVLVDKDSPFPSSQYSSVKEMENDKSSTVLIIEAPGHQVPWMEPTDFDDKTFIEYYESHEGFATGNATYRSGLCMADASVKYNEGYSVKQWFDMFAIRKKQK